MLPESAAYHYIDFLLNILKHGMIRDKHAFEDMMDGPIDGSSAPNEVDVCEAA